MNLTIFDHHKDPDTPIIHRSNVRIIFANTTDDYYPTVHEFLNKPFDYILVDQDHDSMITGILHLLSIEEKPDYKCFSGALKKNFIQKSMDDGKSNIISFNSLRVYNSDLDEFDTITLINPHETGMPNISCCQILYKAMGKSETLWRDLAGIGITSDYTLEEGYDIIIEILKAYKNIFPDLTKRAIELSLNKYNILDSAFGNISQMLWAPVVLENEEGVEEIIRIIVENPEFTYADLLEKSENPVSQYLHRQWEKYSEILEKEKELFSSNKVEDGKFVIYEPEYKSTNFIREFSNMVKDENIDKIIIMKTKAGEGKLKYSIRRGELNVDLGMTLKNMGKGGGNPFAAGCTVNIDDNFEEEFIANVKPLIE